MASCTEEATEPARRPATACSSRSKRRAQQEIASEMDLLFLLAGARWAGNQNTFCALRPTSLVIDEGDNDTKESVGNGR